MNEIKLMMVNYTEENETCQTIDYDENHITIDYIYKFPVIIAETNYFECDTKIIDKIENWTTKQELCNMYNCEDIWVVKKHEIKNSSELITKLDTYYGRIESNKKKGIK